MAPWTAALLLLLHCGVGISLPAPTNVSITSVNLEHTLHFLPGSETPGHTHFRIQVMKVRKSVWKPAARCSSLEPGQTCELSGLMKDPWARYQARAQAYSPAGSTSDWATSGLFQPMTHSAVGPPDVSVAGCGNCLVLQVRPLTSRWQQLERYRHMLLSVRRTRDGVQFHMSVDYEEKTVIGYLEPGVEYCVMVSMVAFIKQKSAPVKYCAFTSPPRNNSSVLLVLLGASGLLAAALVGFLVLRRRLQAGPHAPGTRDPEGSLSPLCDDGAQ
ncbi:interferon alpha/beta receptor 2-like [Gadus chalcogrammus]|uniref:interferon alpha/beta receptor 2-like n=1 Tax=Gadus chalcogrammus TaxID=1042646 RepID=UPI0024C4B4A7|nr:interferon alpha/beta receptor 2-like [Gadus chalcogrammus]